MSRFVVGIDLGTTHCALAVASLDSDERAPAGPRRSRSSSRTGTVEARPLLPSFLYFAHESEGAQPLPWDAERTLRRRRARARARRRRAGAPRSRARRAGSATRASTGARRSCRSARPRTSRRSRPVEASWRYLEHLARGVGRALREGDRRSRSRSRTSSLTVPASFDAAARELTVEAALAAGLEKLTLLEEPQAALYAWIARHGRRVAQARCTSATWSSSSTSAAARPTSRRSPRVEKDGALELERVAVGDHILLGGDNMDLALAHVVAQKLAAAGQRARPLADGGAHPRLPRREGAASSATRREDRADRRSPARGSKLARRRRSAPSSRATRSRDPRRRLLPGRRRRRAAGGARARGAHPARPARTRRTPAVTQAPRGVSRPAGRRARQARGLRAPRATGRRSRADAPSPDGGPLQRRRDEGRRRSASAWSPTLNAWLAADGAPARAGARRGGPRSRGRARRGVVRSRAARARACAFAAARRARTTSASRARCPRCPGIEPPVTALCVAPFGMEEGTDAELPPHELGVVVGEPVRFRFFGSTRAPRGRGRGASSSAGRRTSSRSSRRSRSRCRPKAAARATSCRCGFARASPRSARSSSKPIPRASAEGRRALARGALYSSHANGQFATWMTSVCRWFRGPAGSRRGA